MNHIAARLRQERVRIGLTQGELGKIGGIGANAQGAYERAARLPRADYLAKIVTAGIDVLYVLTGKPAVMDRKSNGDGTTGALDLVFETYTEEAEMLRQLSSHDRLDTADLTIFCENQLTVIATLKYLVSLAEKFGDKGVAGQVHSAIDALNVNAKFIAQAIIDLTARADLPKNNFLVLDQESDSRG